MKRDWYTCERCGAKVYFTSEFYDRVMFERGRMLLVCDECFYGGVLDGVDKEADE